MLGNQELQGEPQDKLSSHLEPDQEVAAVLGADPNFAQAASASVKRNSRCSSSKEIPAAALKLDHEMSKDNMTTSEASAAQYPSIHFLAAQGEIAKIKEEIDRGTDINAVDKTGLTPLAWAAAHRQEGGTALMYAAFNGYPQVVKLLLEHGADITATNNEGYTALGLAVSLGNKNGKLTVLFTCCIRVRVYSWNTWKSSNTLFDQSHFLYSKHG
ncbi:Ankyrin repeat family A protein 2 [Acropora cervicornis]|uniref:Ankyrin repeat family A protein 2 n=1 Tax=Acropora cervicornis TaxID=6130 RepID=A0AAD9PTE2_ACRCE|nr:Ankyrin repeat family A protein 2 [Acropora cervicornis]